jgi:hypothetical protein
MLEGEIIWHDKWLMETHTASEHHDQFVRAVDDLEYSQRWELAGTGVGQDPTIRDSDIMWFDADRPPPSHEPLLEITQTALERYMVTRPEAGEDWGFTATEYSVLRYRPGQAYHAAHSDAAPWETNTASKRHLTLVLYLNTPEEGGEIVFPTQEVTVAPTLGTVLIHPAGWTHRHKTLPVVTGIKYALVVFYHFTQSDENPTISEFIAGA